MELGDVVGVDNVTGTIVDTDAKLEDCKVLIDVTSNGVYWMKSSQ